MIDYRKRLVEVDEILQHLSNEEYDKIPKDVINFIKGNQDSSYKWKYDETKTLIEQDISRDTVAILSYINIKYLLNEEQSQIMQQIYNLNENVKRKSKENETYNIDNIFKKKKVF